MEKITIIRYNKIVIDIILQKYYFFATKGMYI